MGVRSLCTALGILAAGSGVGAFAGALTDGTAGARVELSGDFEIGADLGTRAGDNLFHSFERFSLATGERATFTGQDALANVIGRVTGGARSDIDGTLASTIPGADLWLINPAGIAFGPNARLDVQGSFHVSTADELRFADGSRFSARDPSSSSFTVAAPEAFGFLGAAPPPIAFGGSRLVVPEDETITLAGGDLVIEQGALIGSVGGALHLFSLAGPGAAEVENGGAAASGLGTVRIAGGSTLDTTGDGGGRIRIRAGELTVDGAAVRTSNLGPTDATGGLDVGADTITLGSGAVLANDVLGSGSGGRTEIEAARLDVQSGSAIGVATFAAGDAGRLVIDADHVTLSTKGVPAFTGLATAAAAGSSGRAGEIEVTADVLEVFDNAQIDARSLGAGDAGRITIAAGLLAMDGNSRINAGSSGGGRAGAITIGARRITLAGGTQIANSPRSSATLPGGDLKVEASEALTITGFDALSGFSSGLFNDALGAGDAGDIVITTPRLVIDGGRITTDTEGAANAGSIRVAGTDRIDVTITDTGQIFAGTDGAGAGGAIAIERGGTITIVGTGTAASATPDDVASPTGIFSNVKRDGTGRGGDIEIAAEDVRLRRGGAISAQTTGRGRAGNVEITASGQVRVDDSAIDTAVAVIEGAVLPADTGTVGGALSIRAERVALVAGGTISARSERGPGAAGTITIVAPETLELDGGMITSTSAESGGGRIVILVDRLIDLRASSTIATSVFGGGDTSAGDITIDPRFVVLDGSTILARAQAGRGGNIRIVADNILRSPDSRIDASAETGIDGTVRLSSPDTDLAGDLVVLEGALIDAASLLRERCAARGSEELSSFVGVGRGGLPPGPDQPLAGGHAQGGSAALRALAGSFQTPCRGAF